MGLVRYARPSDNVAPGATVSVSSGTAQSNFPVTRIWDRLSHFAFKLTTNGGTVRWLFGAPKTIVAIVIVNHNLATATVTNAAGLNQAIAIPTTPQDGHPLDPWKPLTATNTSNDWFLAVTGAGGANAAFGEVLLIETLRTLDLKLGTVGDEESHPAIVHPTDYGIRNKRGFGVRQRGYFGQAVTDVQKADILALERDAAGVLGNVLLIPDDAVNDALFVDLKTHERRFMYRDKNITVIDLAFVEQVKGLAL